MLAQEIDRLNRNLVEKIREIENIKNERNDLKAFTI